MRFVTIFTLLITLALPLTLRADDLYYLQREELQEIKQRLIDEWTFRDVKVAESEPLRHEVQRLDERVNRWLAHAGGYWTQWERINHPQIMHNAAAWSVPAEMARAYATPASRHFQNPRVLAGVEAGLRHLLQFAYPGCEQPGNWWAWQIGLPMHLTPTLMLLEGKLDSELFRREVETVRYLLKAEEDAQLTGGFIPPEQPVAGQTDMNALWHNRLRLEFAILIENPAMAGKWARAAFGEMGPPGTGAWQADGSYKFHGQNPMWAYGRAFLIEYALLIGRYEGTYLAGSPEQIERYAQMLEGFVNGFLYRGRLCPAMIGREISRGPTMYENPAVLAALAIMARSEGPRAGEFARLFERERRYRGSTDAGLGRLAAHVWGGLAGRSGSAVEPAPPVDDIFAYPDSDYLQITRPGWAVGIKMHSRRNAGYESINGENLRGWFLSHGSTFHFIDGDEWDGCWPTLDWTRVPGTTVSTEVKGQNQSPFVGVLRASLRVALAAMEFKRDGFTARKSWLVDGDAIVCLGSDISGPGRVETTVLNQPIAPGERASGVSGGWVSGPPSEPEAQARDLPRPGGSRVGEGESGGGGEMRGGEGTRGRGGDEVGGSVTAEQGNAILLIDGRPAPSLPLDMTTDVHSIWFQKMGYVFPGRARVRIMRGPRTSDWSSIREPARHGAGEPVTHEYVTVVIEHGPDVQGYRYIMLPNVEQADWPERSRAVLDRYEFDIDGSHVVRSRDGRLESVVLWAAGETGPIRADRGCMALRVDGKWSVVDPAWSDSPLEIALNGKAISLQTAKGRPVGLDLEVLPAP